MFNGIFIPEGLTQSTAISPGAKLAWGRLARYAGVDGRCHPTVKKLGAEIGVGKRQAQKYLAELEDAKLIRRIHRFTAGSQTSSAFEFLWHELFEAGMNDGSLEGVNNYSCRGANDHAPKESQISEESQFKESKKDSDCSPTGASDGAPFSLCKQYPLVRECLARYMQVPGGEKEYPSDRMVVEILEAAGTYEEEEVVAALDYLYSKRGLKPFTKNGPRSFAWFKTVLQDHFTKKRDRESAANPTGFHEWEQRNETRFSREQREAITDAIELPG
jgi:hypothetical protein